MNPSAIIDRMERMITLLPALASGVPMEDARCKPVSGAWSILEIVNHLVDEETLDFRTRLRMTLEMPTEPWPKTDPEGWAIEKRYNEQDLEESILRFVNERQESLRWLRSLRTPDWSRAYLHPRVGPLHAGSLLASWQAHDALHIRQIAKRQFELASRDAPEYSTRYAGEWGV